MGVYENMTARGYGAAPVSQPAGYTGAPDLPLESPPLGLDPVDLLGGALGVKAATTAAGATIRFGAPKVAPVLRGAAEATKMVMRRRMLGNIWRNVRDVSTYVDELRKAGLPLPRVLLPKGAAARLARAAGEEVAEEAPAAAAKVAPKLTPRPKPRLTTKPKPGLKPRVEVRETPEAAQWARGTRPPADPDPTLKVRAGKKGGEAVDPEWQRALEEWIASGRRTTRPPLRAQK